MTGEAWTQASAPTQEFPHFGFIVSLPLEDRVLPVATYRRTNLTLRQFAPMFGTSKSAAVAEQSQETDWLRREPISSGGEVPRGAARGRLPR